MKTFFTVSLLLISLLNAAAQKNWTLRSDKNGIKIFTRTEAETSLKEIKVQCSVKATLTQMTALLMDAEAGTEWVYATKSCKLIKQVSPQELYYYSEVEMPWPITNRDFIAHLTASQNPQTKVVTVLGPVVNNFVPEKKDIVRVKRSSGKWVLSPAGNGNIFIDYTLVVDPGGSIPVWLVNLFATKGPSETFRKLNGALEKPKYANAVLSYVVN